MKKVNYYSILLLCFVMFLVSVNAHAACIKGSPVWGTGDTRETCKRKVELKQEEKRIEVEKKEREIKRKREALNNNSGIGAGQGNTNVVLGGLGDMLSGRNEEKLPDEQIVVTRHQLRVEVMPFVIPGAYQFDDPGMPEKFFFNGAAWDYYLNESFGIGFLWQQWSKEGGRGFDPVMDNAENPVFFPGAIDRIKYTSYMPYITLNSQLGSPLWNGVFRCGIGRTQGEIEYKTIDAVKYPGAEQPEDITIADQTSIMFDLGVERWTYGAKIGGALRYINARHDTSNYREYVNLGSAQILFYVQFMLRPLGLL